MVGRALKQSTALFSHCLLTDSMYGLGKRLFIQAMGGRVRPSLFDRPHVGMTVDAGMDHPWEAPH